MVGQFLGCFIRINDFSAGQAIREFSFSILDVRILEQVSGKWIYVRIQIKFFSLLYFLNGWDSGSAGSNQI
jgi:hypothetical protein